MGAREVILYQGLVFNILMSAKKKDGVDKNLVKNLMSYWYHLGIISETDVLEDIGKFLAMSMDIEIFEFVLRLVPNPGELTFCRIFLMGVLVKMCDVDQKTWQQYTEITKCAMQYIPVNHQVSIPYFENCILGEGATMLIDFSQAYLTAMKHLRYDLALMFIKKLSYDEIQSASVWLHQMKVCNLNARELLVVLPMVCTFSFFEQKHGDIISVLEEFGLDKTLKKELNLKQSGISIIAREGRTRTLAQTLEILKTVRKGVIKPGAFDKINQGNMVEVLEEMSKALQGGNSKFSSQFEMTKKYTILGVFIGTLEAFIMKCQKVAAQKNELDLYLEKLGMTVSQRKLDLLEETVHDRQPPFLKVFSDLKYEPQCIATVAELLTSTDDIRVRVPKEYIRAMRFTEAKKNTLIRLELISVLELAVLSGFKNVVDMLVFEYNVPLSTRKEGITALHIAIWKGDVDMALVLLGHDEHLVSFRSDSDMLSNWVVEHLDCIDVQSLIKRVQAKSNTCRESNPVIELGVKFKDMYRALLEYHINYNQGIS